MAWRIVATSRWAMPYTHAAMNIGVQLLNDSFGSGGRHAVGWDPTYPQAVKRHWKSPRTNREGCWCVLNAFGNHTAPCSMQGSRSGALPVFWPASPLNIKATLPARLPVARPRVRWCRRTPKLAPGSVPCVAFLAHTNPLEPVLHRAATELHVAFGCSSTQPIERPCDNTAFDDLGSGLSSLSFSTSLLVIPRPSYVWGKSRREAAVGGQIKLRANMRAVHTSALGR